MENNMQMIDVLKRLAELDAQNPNIIKESAVEECGPMGMMTTPMDEEGADALAIEPTATPAAPASSGPANINISAGSGEEVSNMLATIMQLAGVKEVGADDLGAEPVGAVLTAEPSMSGEPSVSEPAKVGGDMKDMISTIDKMNDTDDHEDGDDKEETDEDMGDDYGVQGVDNTPSNPNKSNPFDANEFSAQPNAGGSTHGRATKNNPHGNPLSHEQEKKNDQTMEQRLMSDYKQFVAENEMAPQAQHIPIGQQMANDGITYSREKEGEIIDLMVQYMKKDGMSPKSIRYYLNYDEDYIPDQLSYLPREGSSNESMTDQGGESVKQAIAKMLPTLDSDDILNIVDGPCNTPVEQEIHDRFMELQYDLGPRYEDHPDQVAEKLIQQLHKVFGGSSNMMEGKTCSSCHKPMKKCSCD